MAIRIDDPTAVYLARKESCKEFANRKQRQGIHGKPPVVFHAQVGSPSRIKVITVSSIVQRPERNVLPGGQSVFTIKAVGNCGRLGLNCIPMPDRWSSDSVVHSTEGVLSKFESMLGSRMVFTIQV
jgi:hypothetical protein